jgi:hypothetical protein
MYIGCGILHNLKKIKQEACVMLQDSNIPNDSKEHIICYLLTIYPNDAEWYYRMAQIIPPSTHPHIHTSRNREKRIERSYN